MRKRIAWPLVVVSLVIGVGCLGRGGPGTLAKIKKLVHATVFLVPIGGTCVIRTAPTTVEIEKDEEILWTTVDACHTAPSDITIAFSDNPLQPCTMTGKKVRCKVKGDASPGAKKYSVSSTGAVTEDPELEIVQ